ncbi:MAG: penicillin acylase family protein [bacterium]
MDDDPWYIGGPWYPTRGNTIDEELTALVAAGGVSAADMSTLQSNDRSRLGEMFVPALLGALDAGRRAAESDGELEPAAQRLRALYRADAAGFAEVHARLSAWGEGRYDAASGVETFYHQPDDQDRADAVATMIFNAWLPRFIGGVFDDERIPGWRFSTSRTQVRALRDFLAGRGAENPGQLASWYAPTGESIFFDRLGTEAVETADEIMLAALGEALAFLRGEPGGAGEGGFGSPDMTTWLWGLRHYVKFESLLGGFLGADSGFDAILAMFNITPRQVPLTEERLDRTDPRAGLAGFPRPGDNWGVDGANPGLSGTRFSYGSGPVMRMVIALKAGAVQGVNIIPGGQSALTDSPHFADQTRLWLGNQTIPLRFSLDQVLAGAEGRAVFRRAR